MLYWFVGVCRGLRKVSRGRKTSVTFNSVFFQTKKVFQTPTNPYKPLQTPTIAFLHKSRKSHRGGYMRFYKMVKRVSHDFMNEIRTRLERKW